MIGFLLRQRFEPGTKDFDVDLGSRHRRAGFRQADFSLEEFSFCTGEFVRRGRGPLKCESEIIGCRCSYMVFSEFSEAARGLRAPREHGSALIAAWSLYRQLGTPLGMTTSVPRDAFAAKRI